MKKNNRQPWFLAASRIRALTCLVAASVAWPAIAQTTSSSQKVTGPKVRYWVTGETSTGMVPPTGGGLGSLLGMIKGAAGGSSKRMQLSMDSTLEGNALSADHSIPIGMGMGASLPLTAFESSMGTRQDDREDRDIPEHRDTGNVRLLFFWGCGDTVGAGQPVILDMKQIQNGKLPPNMQSFQVNLGARPPSAGRDKTYLDWPNRKSDTNVPSSASLIGDHQVKGSATPDIQFTVSAAHDFMDALVLSHQIGPSGGNKLSWNQPASATGFFATAMGFRAQSDKTTDMVMWNSSSKRMIGGDRLMGHVDPTEVARLVHESVAMPASQFECQIPKGVSEAAGGNLSLLNLNAFGPELNVVYPPRPQNPKEDWNQEYAVKVRLHSRASAIAGLPGGGALGRFAGEKPGASEQTQRSDTSNPVDGAVNLLKGIFGR